MVFGRTLRDHIPCLPYMYAASVKELRERMMAKFRDVDGKKLARNTKHLKDLPIGSLVAIQNQSGCYPTKWYKTGVVLEVRPMNRLWSRWMGAED